MVYQIVWTGKAMESYGQIIDYLQKEWTEKEIGKMQLATERKLSLLLRHPYLAAAAGRDNRDIRSTIINKRISLIYRVVPDAYRIELLLFWNTYQNPQRLMGITDSDAWSLRSSILFYLVEY